MSGEGFYPHQERADKSRPTRNTDKAYRQPQNGNAADKDSSTHLFVVRLIKSFRSESLSSMGIPLLHPHAEVKTSLQEINNRVAVLEAKCKAQKTGLELRSRH